MSSESVITGKSGIYWMRDKYFLQIFHEWLKDSVLKCNFAFHRMISFKQTISVT